MFKRPLNVSSSSVLPEVVLFESSVYHDHRGEIWSLTDPGEHQILKSQKCIEFHHKKVSKNREGVLRGIHGDNKSWKLVSVLAGSVFQVVVDCRKDSPRFLKYDFFNLYGGDGKSVLLPPGFGNAFLSMADNSVYFYQMAYEGEYFDYDQQFTYRWNDPEINICWPLENPILSERDA